MLNLELADDAWADGLQVVVSLLVDFSDGLKVDVGLLWDEVESSLSLLFLDFEGDSLNRTVLDSSHQMGGEPGDLVSESLGGNVGHILEDLLVDVEVEGQIEVVFLDQLSGGSFYGLGSDSSLFRLVWAGWWPQGRVGAYHCCLFGVFDL